MADSIEFSVAVSSPCQKTGQTGKMKARFVISAFVIFVVIFSQATAQSDSPEGCAGCPEEADPSDPRIQKYAQDAVEEIQKQSNCLCTYHLETITNVTTQVVAGELLHYELILKSVVMQGDVVIISLTACSVDVWIKEWEDFEQITLQSCQETTE
ncbi:hypothetical protein L9F63_017874, partial [Diploptera punctata]